MAGGPEFGTTPSQPLNMEEMDSESIRVQVRCLLGKALNSQRNFRSRGFRSYYHYPGPSTDVFSADFVLLSVRYVLMSAIILRADMVRANRHVR